MLRNGNEPVIKIINCRSEKEAFELEKFLIFEIGRKDLGLGSLLNNTEGGEGLGGANNPRYGDHRSWDELVGKERAAELKESAKIRMTGNKLTPFGLGIQTRFKPGQPNNNKGKRWYKNPITKENRLADKLPGSEWVEGLIRTTTEKERSSKRAFAATRKRNGSRFA
jgi:hypothetical protein